MKTIGRVAALSLLCLAAYAESRPGSLFDAIRKNDLAFLEDQLSKGVDVNSRDDRGSTLLMHAAAFGSLESVQLLLDARADVNVKNALGATALLWAATDVRKTQVLVRKGADVNARSKLGRTPLLVASTCTGCSGIIRILLDKGADPKAKDERGFSGPRLAAAADPQSLRLLLEAGAPFDMSDTDGATPLMAAATACDVPTMRELIGKGARVNAFNTFAGKTQHGPIALTQMTPLMLAAPFCPAAVAKLLLDAGADVNRKDGRGMTPLMFAIASEAQDAGTIRLMIKSGADVNAKSKVGETALDWAVKYGDPEILALLKAAGARRGDPVKIPERPPAPTRPPSEAIEASLGLLNRSSSEFFRQSGCVGCHHQVLTVMATAAARSGGILVDEAPGREFVKMIESQWTRLQEMALERFDLGGGADQEIYSLLALGAAGYRSNQLTDSLAAYIAADQTANGAWVRITGIARPPTQSGVIARTAFAVRALQLYGTPARKAELDERVARAREYLLNATVRTSDDAAMQLAGLHWIGRDQDRIRRLASGLIARQNPDGGWSTTPHLPSDAFATGQALWVLREFGALGSDSPIGRRGVKRLLETQWLDGSWYVRGRSPKFQPYFESGFPYSHDQWMSSTATAWAVMALSPDGK